jgi:arylsulfatase A-like enzyme
VFARHGIELVYEYAMQLDARVGNLAGIAGRTARVLRKKPLPDEGPPLPSTFARPVVDRAARVGVAGAVLFLLDMKRPRDIGPSPSGATRTPRIDRCFAEGFEFENAFSSSTRTMSVLSSWYTATYAGSRGHSRPDLAFNPYWFVYQKGVNNLVEALRAADFRAIALTNRYYLQYLDEPTQRPLFGAFDQLIAADETHGVNEGLLAALSAHPQLVPRDGRFLLVVHVMSHPPEELPGVDAVVSEVCAAVQRAGRMQDTVFMLTADHGVQYGEHGRQTYGRTLFQEELHVPLRWRIPGAEGGVVEGAVSALDHFPTLLDLLGIEVPFALEGRSYARAFRGQPLDPDRPIFFEVRRYEVPSVGVVRRRMKLIRWPRTGTHALFSLASDPGELRNLADDPKFSHELGVLDGLLTRFVQERH